jgi:ribonuclease VapC
MIFVDASALTAVICRESASDRVLRCLENGTNLFTSPLAVYETVVAVARVTNYTFAEAYVEVQQFLERAAILIEPLLPSHAEAALVAFERFGKGRHPAKLNMGDCFAYAATKSRNAALLFIGDDFSQTDIPKALAAN